MMDDIMGEVVGSRNKECPNFGVGAFLAVCTSAA